MMRKTTWTLLIILAAMLCRAEVTASRDSPNIIFILADDLGYGDLGCYGQELIQTPRLDQMAAEGMRFRQHYAGSPVCAPSRAILMTGLHSGHVSVRGNAQWEGPEQGQLPLRPDEVTIARVLQEAGYRTGMFGKWGLGNPGTPGDPLVRGWDTYFGYTDQILAHNYYPEFLLRDGEKVMLRNEVRYLSPEEWHKGLGSYATKQVDYSHDLIVEAALDFVRQHREAPFFLYLPFTIPHDNGEAPNGFKIEVPSLEPYADKDWHRESRAYAAAVTRMDRDIGRLLDLLDALDLTRETIVFFSSDNGPNNHTVYTERFESAGGLRGYKRDCFEGGIRVPLIVHWPGQVRPGTVSDHVSAFWDFFPTACALAQVESEVRTDGISFLPELLGQPQPSHDHLYWEFPLTYMGAGHGYQVAVRWGDWKGIRVDLLNHPEAPIQLYNLATDPREEHDVAADHPEVVAQIRHLMHAARTPSEAFIDVPRW